MSGTRADAMAARLTDTASRLGMDADARALVLAAFQVAMAPRRAAGLDEHHPDALHPARTALILMDDVQVADPIVVAAGLVTETRDPALRADPGAVAALGAGVEPLAAGVPDPAGSELLVERLVGADRAVLRIALAERLDHARHLHLRPVPEWGPEHSLTCTCYGPLAPRAHAVLERRFTWWCRTFERRFLRGR